MSKWVWKPGATQLADNKGRLVLDTPPPSRTAQVLLALKEKA